MIPDALAALAQVVGDKGTFFDYVRIMLVSKELSRWGVLMSAGVLGICANYFYKWVTEQISGSLWIYLFEEYPRRTLLAFTLYVSWTFVAITTGLVSEAMSWSVIINLGASTGFAVDALVNKARRSQWTEEERTAHVVKQEKP